MRMILALLVCASFSAAQPALPPEDLLAKNLLRELIEIDTTHSTGSTGRAAEAMAVHLRAAGFEAPDLVIVGPRPERANLVARLRGSGKGKPVLLISHLDVVEARRSDWSTDPFRFVEKDGYYYGRGTIDIKSGDALLVANFLRWKREGWVPARDVILALTADEEAGGYENGVAWLIHHKRDLIDADYCLNPDGGNIEMKKGKYLLQELQVGEKNYLTFTLEVKNKGGHSSLPEKDNAIYRLADGLGRLARFDFPAVLDASTRAYFEAIGNYVPAETAAAIRKMLSTTPPDSVALAKISEAPDWNAMLRTTCVATMLEGGHAENALPQSAKATVNCRILPGDSAENVEATLRRVSNDPQILLTANGEQRTRFGTSSPLRDDVAGAIRKVTEEMWPGLPVVPIISQGGTDGKYLRMAGIPTYGVSGIADDYDDVRAHGRDERIAARALFEGREFFYRLVTQLANEP
jgi:acetylornithine deacetylase/succinyl-diaminopimelate desuccinylase-like protein